MGNVFGYLLLIVTTAANAEEKKDVGVAKIA